MARSEVCMATSGIIIKQALYHDQHLVPIIEADFASMDPFKSDDEETPGLSDMRSHQQSRASQSPPRQRPEATDMTNIEDPFTIDQSHVAGTCTSRVAPMRSKSASGTDSQQSLDASTASRLLSNSEAGPSQLPEKPSDHLALPMGEPTDREQPNQESIELAAEFSSEEASEEESRLLDLARRPHQRSTPSTSGRPRSRQSGRYSPMNDIVKTISAVRRRISRAASQAEAEDQRSRRDGSLIRLQSSEAGITRVTRAKGSAALNFRERALWMWVNVDNLDEFLKEMYDYYVGRGVVCIALSRALNLLTVAFVIGFSTFLFGCLDYSRARHNGNLSELIVEHCVSRFSTTGIFFLFIFGCLYALQLVKFGSGLSRLYTMHHFFENLLGVPDADIQTIQWHQVVSRLSKLLETHPLACLASSPFDDSPQSIDVHEVANRLMRQHNFLIALLDHNLLDLELPGLAGNAHPLLTKSLLWNLEFCLLGYLFDHHGNVRKPFLSARLRQDLIDGLWRRLFFMAAINLIFAPFIIMYILAYSFFRYFEEYHKNPAYLGSRQYTELARWKFREYNELPHLFRRRCHNSYPYAERYIQQFPRERTAILARFVSFIAGSFAAVLIVPSLMDPDLFLHFDITPQRNTLFYIGVFGAILAAARGMVPDERLVFEPETLLNAVIHHTHYCPPDWKGRFHSAEVNAEFGKLYSLKLTIFVTEVLSVIVTPFVLAFSMPKSAPAIVDFFREETVHMERLGHVCSYAVFDNASHGGKVEVTGQSSTQDAGKALGAAASSASDGSRSGPQQGYTKAFRGHRDRDDKLEQSVLNFASANAWQPDHPETSLYLVKLRESEAARIHSVSLLRRRSTRPLHFSDEAFECSVVAASSTQARVDAGRPAVTSAKTDHSSVRAIDNCLGESVNASSASAIGGDFVDPMRGFAHSKITGLAPISDDEDEDEDGDDGLAAAGAPGPKSVMQHVQRRML